MIATCALLGAACIVVAAQEIPTEDDLVLLQPYLERVPLGDGIEAFAAHGTVLVPLGEICRLLAFGIQVDPERTHASGYFISPKRSFSLDLDRGLVEVAGRPASLGRAVRMPRDLYVDVESLAAWFPLEVKVYLKESIVMFTPRERLPIQDTWARDAAYGRNPISRYGVAEPSQGPVRPVPFDFFDLPAVDLNLGLTQSQDPARTQGSGTATLGGDLLWMSSDLFLCRDTTGSWGNSRYSLFREDPEGRLLGPMKARRLVLGDLLTSPAMDLVGALPQGRGVSLDNFPVTYRTRFSSQTFRGQLAEGWSVELFQNDALIAFQRSRADGLYDFPDVPLRFGVNEFRLVFHGPLGENRVQSYRLDIAQNQVPPGTFYYGIAGVRPTQKDLGLADISTVAGAPPPEPRQAYLAQGEYGLSKTFSILAGSSGLQLQDGGHHYETIGGKGVWSFLAAQVTAAQDHGPDATLGRALEGIVSTGLGYSSLTVRRDQFSGGFQRSIYDSTELGAFAEKVKNATGVNLNLSGKLFGSPSSVAAELDQEGYQDGRHGVRERGLLATQIGSVNYTNMLNRLSLPDQSLPMQGIFTATSFIQAWGGTGTLWYTRAQPTGWGLQAQYYGTGGWQYQAGFRSPLGPADIPGYQAAFELMAGVAKLSGHCGFSFNLQKAGSNFTAALQFQVSLGREPRTGKWSADAQSLATTGAVSAVAFMDARGDRVRQPGDANLADTRFKVGGAETSNRIEDPVVTFITKLPRSQPVALSLDETSLDDPSQQSVEKVITVVPRPGKTIQLDFPVANFGEINGTTRVQRGARHQELPGLELELLDGKGRRVKVLRSAYDGFFEFSDLPVGPYTLRVTPEETARIRIKPAQRQIQISTGHPFLDGLDLVVEPDTPAENPVKP